MGPAVSVLAVLLGWCVPAILLVDLNQGFVGLLCSCQAVLILIGSKLHSCFPFHQSCADLHDYRLDGVCAAPALFGQQLHADGTATQDIPPRQHWGHNPYKWWIERKVIFKGEV